MEEYKDWIVNHCASEIEFELRRGTDPGCEFIALDIDAAKDLKHWNIYTMKSLQVIKVHYCTRCFSK